MLVRSSLTLIDIKSLRALAGISVEASVPANSSFTAAHIWLLACQTQIIANIVQFAFVLFTMAKEERVKENGGRGLPLSLQSLQGGSTVDTGRLKYHVACKLFHSFLSVTKKSSGAREKERTQGDRLKGGF